MWAFIRSRWQYAHMATDRTTVLLGAGASVEAGLPTSTKLTEKIAGFIGDRRWTGLDTTTAFHVAVGAMIAHDTGRGHKAYEGIDVERLFAAIRMLADRDSLEIAPFVASWNANLDTLGSVRGLPSFWGSDFRKEISDSRFGNSGLERTFREGVTALAGSRDLRSTFTNLQDEMIAALNQILTVDPARTSYLAPLLSKTDEQLQIATLNYDLSVELVADRAQVSYDTGIRQWRGGYQWKWRPGVDLRLLKLHGSLGWYFGNDEQPGKLRSDIVRIAEDLTEDQISQYRDRLALVFGQGAKLRSNGPFLAMLLEFDKFLERTDQLVVVGYSFRDDHINAAIRRWFNKRREPRMVVINPDIDNWAADYSEAPLFYNELLEARRANEGGILGADIQLLSTTAGVGLLGTFGTFGLTGTRGSNVPSTPPLLGGAHR